MRTGRVGKALHIEAALVGVRAELADLEGVADLGLEHGIAAQQPQN